jgi:hypothetical protein
MSDGHPSFSGISGRMSDGHPSFSDGSGRMSDTGLNPTSVPSSEFFWMLMYDLSTNNYDFISCVSSLKIYELYGLCPVLFNKIFNF